MTGPLDFLTTSRLGDNGQAGAIGGADAIFALVSFALAGLTPFSTATAPIMALRTRNVRRSKPAGAASTISGSTIGAFSQICGSALSTCLSAAWLSDE